MNNKRFVRSVSLGYGILQEDEQKVASYTPTKHHTAAPRRTQSTVSTTTTTTTTATTTDLDSSSSSSTRISRSNSPFPSAPTTADRCFLYEYNVENGLPVFDIDQCDDEELLGGEICPLPNITREDELVAIKEIRSHHLTVQEKKELTDPRMIVRHFRAEKGNAGKALETFRDALQWRRDFEADALRVCMMMPSSLSKDCPPVDDINNKKATLFPPHQTKDYQAMMRLENETGKIFVRGTTLEGRALMYMFAMRNNTKSDIDNMRHLVWNLEKAIRVTHHHSNGRLDKYCLLIDCANYSLAKAPSLQASKMTLDVLQKHFKERIHRIYILNPPWAFTLFWKMVKPFIDPVTKTKIVFCTSAANDEGVQQLRGEVGPIHAPRMEPCAFGTERIREFNSKEYLELPMQVGFDE